MRLVTRKGLATALAAGGALAAATGYAYADAGAQGTSVGAPGLLSGDLAQIPVHLPVNVCGDTVNVVGLLNPAAGNACANTSATAAAPAAGGATAQGAASDSPGLGSGLAVQLPVHAPVNVSGDSVGVVSVLNPTAGNVSVNGPAPVTTTTARTHSPARPAAPRPATTPVEKAHTLPARASLATTGADGVGYVAVAGAASLLGGLLLYRRVRPGART